MNTTVEKAKRFVKCMLGKDFYARLDCTRPTIRLGSQHAGWEVDVGNIDHRSVIYSFGVGEDISFDLDLIERCGCSVHAFDPTPKAVSWVRSQSAGSQFVLHEYGLADVDGTLDFHPPQDPAHVSYSMIGVTEGAPGSIQLQVRSLATIMTDLGHEHVDLLKMDIEGAEYRVIDAMALGFVRPSQILLEFHHRFPEIGVGKTKAALRKLKEMGYLLYSVSPNGEEYSFVHG